MVSATWMVDKADQVTRGNKKYVGRLFPGIISAVNIAAKTYAIAYDDGCTETDVPFEGRVTLRTQLTAKEKTRATLAAKKERLARVEAEAAALEAEAASPPAALSAEAAALSKWALATPSPGPDPPDSLVVGSASATVGEAASASFSASASF